MGGSKGEDLKALRGSCGGSTGSFQSLLELFGVPWGPLRGALEALGVTWLPLVGQMVKSLKSIREIFIFEGWEGPKVRI